MTVAALRALAGETDLATQRLLDHARQLTEADLRVPSLLPGWTRAHVLTHLARDADAMRELLAAARAGPPRAGYPRAGYPSAAARAADIERGAARSAPELMTDVADSAMALRAFIRQLPDQVWAVPVRLLDEAPFPAAELAVRRLSEVELHHADLGAGYGSADWPAAFADLDLPEPMGSQRAERLRRPPAAVTAATRPTARPVAPWRPGQRLPGSWIGPAPGTSAD
jgi:maleylpyruvate isomerase